MGLESESGMARDAFIARFDLCDNLSDYANPVATDISTAGTKCKKNMKWAWTSGRSGKTDMFGYSAVSPDKSFIIAAGTRQGSTKSIAHRWLVKFDANTGLVSSSDMFLREGRKAFVKTTIHIERVVG